VPKNNVTDLITDQEIAFARLILSGTMTDREAAQAAGLNPDTAAYTKAKPRVSAYILEHRAALQQQLVEQEADTQRRKEQRREQVLDRLWEIAKLSAEMTRGSITGQVKALSMIVAIEGLIPDRRAGSLEKTPVPAPSQAEIHPAAWFGRQQEQTLDPQPDPALAQKEDEPVGAELETTPGSDPRDSAVVNPLGTPLPASYVPTVFTAPDTRAPFSARRR
jgi:hypothetical protein